MKVTFAPKQLKVFKERNRLREELTESQAARVKALVAELQKPTRAAKTSPTVFNERRMALPQPTKDRALIEAAESLGVNYRSLNRHQRHLLVSMAQRPMTNRQRLELLEEAAA